MLLPKSNIPRWIVIVADLMMSLVALFVAYLIRFDLETKDYLIRDEWAILSKSIGFYIAVKLIVFYVFKIHKGLIRHTSTQDFARIVQATAICSVIFFAASMVRVNALDGYYLFPMSVLIMEFAFATIFIVGLRFSVKLIYLESVKSKEADGKVIIYGAGISGLITKRTIEKAPETSYRIVGFLDDNKKLAGNRLEGITIYHTSALRKVIENHDVTQLIVAIQDPDQNNRKAVVELCLELGVEVQKVPSTKSWINGEFSTKQISKIKIDDLLGRQPIRLDEEKIGKELTGETILVTGAAGSIGSGMVRQIAAFEPSKLILLDQAESPLYDLQNALRDEFQQLTFEVVIGDIRSADRMENVFRTYQPHYVFHAAAYKHVPLMEDNPSEAVLTNVLGTKNLVDLAVKYKVFKFVMISTDKAVNPTNVMGASKRIAEIYAQNTEGETRFITTRFGNVLGSNGSVIPLFQRQLDQGGPLTVTDERITRYFMTIPEACQLVLEAGTMGEGGEIFVFDMGESVKIIDLAKKMIQLSGLTLGKDIEIKITGLRPGEKLYEELLAKEENTLPTHHPQILKAKMREEEGEQMEQIKALISLFGTQNNLDIVRKMKEIVPEFISNNSLFEELDKK
ncbi:MAG: polysaccharide biosynthesis protein [Fluviicola sp. XM-24bin1]|nr:MAG: polysaccharide biosynthesis protein [Fluviicola sp. XM-24bin1]